MSISQRMRRAFALLLTTFAGFLIAATPHPSFASGGLVTVLNVEGIISPASADFIAKGLRQAKENGAMLVVLELDTPGGLDSSMRTIIRQILSSPMPIATFVSPGGARAASAGTFILYASHVAAMTPASNLGAASPVSIGGGPAGQDKGADKKDGTDTMTSKVTNDAAAYLRSLAQLRGRNADFAEKAVLEASSMSAQEALSAGVIDLIAGNVPELLQKLDGKAVTLDSGASVTLATQGARIERIEPDWRNRILSLLANPQIAVLLMMVGIYGLFFELTSPGVALPGVAGLICLLLGLYAFQMLPVNWAGVGLLAAGAAMMIAEAFLPSFGVLGVGGIVAFVLGGLLLTDTGLPGYDLTLPFLTGVALVSFGMIAATGWLAARGRRHRVVSGEEQMPGLPGVVTSVIEGTIYAEVRGESWRVSCDQPLQLGDRIRVLSINGLLLTVERVASGPGESHTERNSKGDTHVL
jgi:membrane-bound serine protease (ClpP class)